MSKSSKGFTIVELLVVVAIISALTAIVLSSSIAYVNKSKDARRKADLSTMQKALTNYFVENGSYPSTGGGWRGTCGGYGSYGTSGANGYIPNLAPTYIGTLPMDPNGNNAGATICGPATQGCYLYNSDGIGYKLLAHCTPSSFSSGDPFYDPARPNYSYMVCSQSEPYCSSW